MKIDKKGRKLSDSCLSKMGGKGRFSPKHGMKGTAEYRTWADMKSRCLNPNRDSYKNYGARGILVCDRWLNSFENFYLDLGPRPDGYSLERKDPNGNYEPGNVEWIPLVKQQSNKRNNLMVNFRGEVMTATQYALATNQKPDSVRSKIRHGRPLKDATAC
ncbi:hypothetical protein [Serratia proteamaculans]|nr:hypothetical protein AI28_06895 [bacteria symbiont BFo1 of Frankliniella occidentalis]